MRTQFYIKTWNQRSRKQIWGSKKNIWTIIPLISYMEAFFWLIKAQVSSWHFSIASCISGFSRPGFLHFVSNLPKMSYVVPVDFKAGHLMQKLKVLLKLVASSSLEDINWSNKYGRADWRTVLCPKRPGTTASKCGQKKLKTWLMKNHREKQPWL